MFPRQRNASDPGGPGALALGGVLLLLLLVLPDPVQARQVASCPAAADPSVGAGWEAYQAGDMLRAGELFRTVLSLCPTHPEGATGLGYVALRNGSNEEAAAWFQRALEGSPGSVDAHLGVGLLAWRRGDLATVLESFRRVEELDPGNETAREYLARVPPGVGTPPVRPPLVLPDSLVLPARTTRESFQVRGPRGWTDVWIRGMNLGAALPGRNPSEFPGKETYSEWMEGMARMQVNTVRVYTIHPPAFYDALLEHNQAHPEAPIRVVHGVWTELPADDDFLGPAFEEEFFGEMRRVVDVIHGRADLAPRPGHASGFYTADVSPWTLAYIIGREWEPHAVAAFDSIQTARAPGEDAFRGRFVEVLGGNAMDRWLGRAVDTLVAYETDRYRTQRPVAWTNWPTLDPLHHPTESTREEETRLRRNGGERVDVEPREYNNDEIGVDPSLLRPTERFPAGTFAAYHVYPYYPDFLILSERYADGRSSLGDSHFFAYLQELRARHTGIPLLIAEYGVPASHGPTHLQPQGWHHGGHGEEEMAEINRRLTLELDEAGTAGGMLFAWIDEWFKKNWLVIEFELPEERNRLWYNRLDAEQHYGVVAMEATPPVEGETLEERLREWEGVPPLHEGSGLTVRAAHDAAYLWLLLDREAPRPGDRTLVGLDILDPDGGNFRWPGSVGADLPVGVEFVVVDDGREVRILAHPPVNPFRMVPVAEGGAIPPGDPMGVLSPPPGLFHGRLEQRMNFPYTPVPLWTGVYDSLRVIPNRRRIGRDGREFPALGYDRGVLREGPPPDGFFERRGGVLELRIPWLLVNVTDPSSRSVLWTPGGDPPGVVRTPEGRIPFPVDGPVPSDTLGNAVAPRTVEDIGVVAAVSRQDGSWVLGWQEGSGAPRFSWPTWEEPTWRARERPVLELMARTFREIAQGRGEELPDAPPLSVPPGPRDREPADTLLARADEAWRLGDPEAAEILYRQILQDSPGNTTALHRVALAAAWSDRIDEGLTLLGQLLVLEPGNVDARLDQARFLAWQGRHGEALSLLDSLATSHPRHPGVLEERARVQGWAGLFEASLSTYDLLLGIQPGEGSIRRDRARTLAWAEDFDGAVALWDSLLVEAPSDPEARMGRARALAHANRLDEALAGYADILRGDPGNPEALRERGRTLAWAGRLMEAEELLRGASRATPTDMDARLLLSQVLQWQGRPSAALSVVREAEALAPGRGDVAERRRQLLLAFRPAVRSSVSLESDSDENRMVTLATSSTVGFGGVWSLRGDVYHRWLAQPGLRRRAMGGQLGVTLSVDPGWSLALGAGRSGTDASPGAGSTLLSFALASPPRHPVRLRTGWSRSALDATAGLADRGVVVEGPELSLDWEGRGWSLAGSGSWSAFQGVQSNTRRSAALALSRGLPSGFRVGAAGRVLGFSRDLAEGYFSPSRFQLVEGTVRWLREPGRWSLLLEGAAGFQRIREADPVGTVRASSRIAHRPAPGREIFLGAGISSAGTQSFASDIDYRYTALVAGVAWVF